MIFSTVFGPHEPAFTVGSFAITQTGRPAIFAIPVTTPSAPKPSLSQFASSASSANLPESTSRSIRSRPGPRAGAPEPLDPLAHGQFALLRGLLAMPLGPAGSRALQGFLEALH